MSAPVKWLPAGAKAGPKWNAPTTSLRTAPRAVAGTVAPKQRVRVVRLATSAGRPVVSLRTVVGQRAADAAVTEAQQAPGSLAVTVDRRRTASADSLSKDPLRAQQWALTTLGAEHTWQYSRGAGVTVAVVDSGVSRQPDLAGQILPGVDYVTGTGDGTADGNGHGTHVAGIVAALAGNNLGITGIAPSVKILPVRVLDAAGGGYDSDVANGIIYAADHGAGVINLSLGGPGSSPVLETAVNYARSRNVLVVAAAGNDGQNGSETSYPAAYPGVLAVAASDNANDIASFSTRGSYVQIAAPGVGIISTVPGGYALESGTSMATPYAAGVAALVRAAAPGLTENMVAADLTGTAIDLGPAGRDVASGAGLVSPIAAVCAVSVCGATPAVPGAASAITRIDVQKPPATIGYGQSALLRARLVEAATGRGSAGQLLMWCFGAPGVKAGCVPVKTDANGWASYRLAPLTSGQLEVDFTGSSQLRASVGTKFSIGVPPAITLRPGRAWLGVTIRPTVRERYTLQRYNGKIWVTLRSGTTDGLGRVNLSKLPTWAYVRLVIAAAGGRPATSAPVRIL